MIFRVLHVINSTNPAHGGPIEGVKQLVMNFQKKNIVIEVVTSDPPNSPWNKAFPCKVYELGPSFMKYSFNVNLIPWMKKNAHSYDFIIVNGIWQFSSFAVWRTLKGTNIPYFIFTHGMLDPWFKQHYPLKHIKKFLYWLCFEYRILRDAKGVIYTCQEECLLARTSFWPYRCNEFVVAYGTSSPPTNLALLRKDFLLKFPQLMGKRLILFLSRVHEKKGCDLLLEAFSKTANTNPDLHLVIAGPDNSKYADDLKRRANKFGLNHRITWTGLLLGEDKWGAFYAAELFCLPSHQENFGIVVAEALACGKPVLITNKVNIWREIYADGAGLIGEDNSKSVFKLLKRWLALTTEERRAMEYAARECFIRRFSIEGFASDILNIFTDVKSATVNSSINFRSSNEVTKCK